MAVDAVAVVVVDKFIKNYPLIIAQSLRFMQIYTEPPRPLRVHPSQEGNLVQLHQCPPCLRF